MERKHFKNNTNCAIASRDVKHAKAQQEILAAKHEERKQAISMMSFSFKSTSIRHYSRAYVMIFSHKLYLHKDEVQRALDAGYKVMYE